MEMATKLKIACLEEIAYRNAWISFDVLEKQFHKFKQSSYGDYLAKLMNEKI